MREHLRPQSRHKALDGLLKAVMRLGFKKEWRDCYLRIIPGASQGDPALRAARTEPRLRCATLGFGPCG